MPTRDIDQANYGDMSSRVDDVTVDAISTDNAGAQKETIFQNSKWTQYFGYYKKIPEVKIAIDTRAIWTIGKGFTTEDAETKVILDHISGWGNDTFNNILKNMIIIRRVNGDSFAEIIRKKDGTLLNLKPLDPGSIKIIVNEKGIIKRYEQITGNKTIKFEPTQIFHLVNNRVADEIHGVSDIEAIEKIIKASNESFEDMQKLMHRYVKPMMKFILDTDDQAKIDALITKFDEAVNKGENLFIPKGTVDHELIAVPSNATLNPLPWRDHLRNYFFQVVGIPQIIMGSSGEFTESTAKIAYLAFQQSVEDEQRDIEEQIWNQLYLKIKLTFPATMRNELLSMQEDEQKDKGQALGFQPSDVTVGMGAGT